jgi:ribosome biogenesis GTPase A
MVHGSAKSITQKQSIPEEILLLILSYVEKCSEQFANLCAVSKYIYSLASVDIFWERIWSKRYNTKKVTKNYRFAFIQLQQVHEIQEQLKAQQNTTVAVLGAANIGKSALVLRICRGQYMENFYPTMYA